MGGKRKHEVIVSLAANCDHEENLSEARKRLEQVLPSPYAYSPVLWTDPVGGGEGKYLNQLVRGYTFLNIDDFQASLKQIEQDMGRTPEERQQGIVRIDLDLLEYDGQRHHLRDWDRPYLQQLLIFVQESYLKRSSSPTRRV